MLFKTNRPYYTINRDWKTLVADSNWNIETNEECFIEPLTFLFWKVVKTVPKTVPETVQ